MPLTSIPLPFEGLASVLDGLAVPKNQATDLRNVRLERDYIERGPGGTQFAPPPVLASGRGFRVGSFNKSQVTGQQTIQHTLGATPVALILWTASTADFGPAQRNARYSIGMTDGAVVSANRGNRSVSVSVREAASPTSTFRRKTRAMLTILSRDNGITISECSWVSWSGTQFVIDWTVNNGDSDLIFYMLIGGSGMAATLTAWNASATGNVATTHNLGATPVVALTMHAGIGTDDTDATDDHAILGFGANTTADEFAQAIAVFDNLTTGGQSWRVFEPNQSIVGFDTPASFAWDAPTKSIRATFVSFSSTEFTYNFSALSSAARFFTLCISGIEAEVQVQEFPLFPDPFVADYAADFNPQAIVFASVWGIRKAQGLMHWSLGATDTSQERVASMEAGSLSGMSATKHAHRQVIAIDGPFEDAEAAPFSTQFVRADYQAQAISELAADGQYTLNYKRNRVFDYSSIADSEDRTNKFGAVLARFTSATDGGRPRNLFHLKLSDDGEKYLLLTNKRAFVYNSGTSLFTDPGETWDLGENRRFAIASLNNLMVFSSRNLEIGGVPTLRTYDGTTFGNLITVGQNHSANIVLAFNDRIVTADTRYDPGSGQLTAFNTQIRWCKNGQYNKWSGLGSGSLLAEETSNEPLTGGFVLGDRAFLGKRHELIELIATGTLSPVFRQESRSTGLGILCRHSVAIGESTVFFMGPDDVYMWNGDSFAPIGKDVYKTLRAQIDYQRLNEVQGVVYTPESLYILITGYNLGGNFWAYDYRRDRWFRDSFQDIRAIGTFDVGVNFTTDIDASSFIVLADSDRTTWRLDDTVLTYRNKSMDSYIATKDFPSQRVALGPDGQSLLPTLGAMTVLKRVFVLVGANTETFDVSVSADEGVTWETTTATPNAYKIAVAHFSDGVPFLSIRFRFRSINDDDFVIRAAAYEWEEGGEILAADTEATTVLPDLEEL